LSFIQIPRRHVADVPRFAKRTGIRVQDFTLITADATSRALRERPAIPTLAVTRPLALEGRTSLLHAAAFSGLSATKGSGFA
jgi:hypothetical protein